MSDLTLKCHHCIEKGVDLRYILDNYSFVSLNYLTCFLFMHFPLTTLHFFAFLYKLKALKIVTNLNGKGKRHDKHLKIEVKLSKTKVLTCKILFFVVYVLAVRIVV